MRPGCSVSGFGPSLQPVLKIQHKAVWREALSEYPYTPSLNSWSSSFLQVQPPGKALASVKRSFQIPVWVVFWSGPMFCYRAGCLLSHQVPSSCLWWAWPQTVRVAMLVSFKEQGHLLLRISWGTKILLQRRQRQFCNRSYIIDSNEASALSEG